MSAHCGADKEVVLELAQDGIPIIIQNGEVVEKYVCDDRRIVVYESLKGD